jgi:hypothetical protein
MHHYIFCTESANEKNQIVDIALLMIRNKQTFVIFVFIMLFVVYQKTIHVTYSQVKTYLNSANFKVSLNSDGQQFHQHKQNEQSPLTFTHYVQKTRLFDDGHPGHVLGQAQ